MPLFAYHIDGKPTGSLRFFSLKFQVKPASHEIEIIRQPFHFQMIEMELPHTVFRKVAPVVLQDLCISTGNPGPGNRADIGLVRIGLHIA